MRLAQRLLLGAVFIVTVLMVVAVALAGQRLRAQLQQLTETQLSTEARLIAQQWVAGIAPDLLADSAGAALGQRVTLIDASGVVLGDSEFDGVALAALQNHNARPEIIEARAKGRGASQRVSPSEGDEELYVALSAGDGRVARVSISTAELDAIVSRARTDVLFSGLIALGIAIGLAAIFSRQVSRPVAELRDVASAIASGDLSRRPHISAPGEIGELATALQRMSEQLGSRLAALQAEDELLRALVESLAEGVVAVDSQRRVIRMNETARVLMGIRQGLPFPANLLPRDRGLWDAMDSALSGIAVERVETQFGSRTLALTARPLGIGGAVLALFDLTGVRRLETVRRDFVANVSHELKTPLTAIRGYAETLVAELSADPQHSQFAETIRANAERMQHLVDDLLDLSRIESGGWIPSPVLLDLAGIAGETIAPYLGDAAKRGCALEVSVADNADTLCADPVALRQALGNLIENAVRHTPSGGTVTVFSRRELEFIALGVRDTGAGIPKHHLPRVFERFYRVDASRSRAAGGTGLGLAIVKHLVEAHGGRVAVESSLGRGTIVTMYFPVP
ncbi:MAG TPA: ATP-binding protein [Gemmatimonadaceae bacterium]|nr:ATP-binding protein [Gemmatimonadaceae bacterium]